MPFITYILHSSAHDKYYIGHTNNIENRLEAHNSSLRNTFTSKYRPWDLFWSISFDNRSKAMACEKYLKQKNKDFYNRLRLEEDLVSYVKERFS